MIHGVKEMDTYVCVDDDEIEVTVEYETSPAEPDVNWAGDLTICTVTDREGKQVDVPEQEIENLIDRVTEWENTYNNPYDDPRY